MNWVNVANNVIYLPFLCWKYMTTFAFVDSAPISCAGKHVREVLFKCQSPTFSKMF